MMTRLFQYPLLAACLFGMWVVLAERFSPGQILLGIVVAVSGVRMMRALRIERPLMRRPAAVTRLIAVVTMDIVRSNIAVARIIVRGRERQSSNFLSIPLELRDPMGLAVLACILTATPGTIWLNYDRTTGHLLLHILDLVDEETWVRLVKDRYERLLMEILR